MVKGVADGSGSVQQWLVSLTLITTMASAQALAAFDAGSPDRESKLQTITISQANASVEASLDADVENVHRVLGTFTTKQSIFRKYVLIEPGLSDEQVVAAATQLHALEPETWFYLMDSDSEFEQMLAALAQSESGNLDNWPSDYVEAHFVARTLEELRGDGKGDTIRVWLIEGGPSRSGLAVDL